jgi:hypothetical protein
VEAVRQDVDQKPAEELGWLERHGLVVAGSLEPVVTPVASAAMSRLLEMATR